MTLQALPAYSQGNPDTPVLGEQVDGTLLQNHSTIEGEAFDVWQLTPAEVTGCGLDRGSVFPGFAEAPTLPPIHITVNSGYYEKVPVIVAGSSLPPGTRRRRSMASRGAHTVQSGQRVVYRSVYRRQQRKLDI